MPNNVPSRLGQVNGANDVLALFLKVFAGEVLTAFSETNVFMSRHMTRSISSGKSASFPASWKGTAAYHTPGARLPGTAVLHNERIITVDDLLVADRFIANIDEAMNHYEVRAEYSRDIGRALSRMFDDHVARTHILAAQAAATVTGGFGGTVLTDTDGGTDIPSFVQTIFDAAAALDDKDVPDEDRYLYVTPTNYYRLVNSVLVDKDVTNGNGGRDSGTVHSVAGIEIVKTRWLPTTNVTTGNAKYRGDFRHTIGIVAQKGAVGTVKLIDLGLESEYQIERQGTLMLGKYALGHGILRPECSVHIRTAAPI